MPRSVERRWEADPSAMAGRSARSSFRYEAFVPDPIGDLDPVAPLETADLAADAEAAVRELNHRGSISSLDAIGPLLLRSEAIASSRLEGYQISPLNLAKALIDPRAARGAARIVAANVSAMEEAIALGDRPGALRIEDILSVHETLMHDEKRAWPGRIRAEQNWIGGRLENPSDANFIPPPEDELPGLLEDLIEFVNRNDLSTVAQAAIAHAQFETIHPFIDGNGRVGRCLIHIVLRRRGVAPHFAPPVSIILAARPASYIAGLTAFQEGRTPDWIDSFAGATRRAASASSQLAENVVALQSEWMVKAGRPRSDSAAAKLISLLPALPVLSAPTARAAIGVSQQQTLIGLKALAEAGVVRQISRGTYDRQFAATDLFDLLSRYENRLAGRPTSPG